MSSKKSKTKEKSKSGSKHLLKGVLDITRSGMGYVVIAEGRGDVLVKPGDFNTALHGDKVRVKVIKENMGTGRKEGKITEVIQRKQTEFVGVLQMGTNYGFFVSDSDKPMPDIYIPLESINGAKNKDHVVVKLLKWEKTDKKPVGEVISVLKPEDINDSAMKELLASNGFPLSFDEQALKEANKLTDEISPLELRHRRDFREVLSFTIDPVDAKDFDDALSIRSLDDGWHEVGVHIADVSHYVLEGTTLDDEAYKRATSVYLPDRVNPMLPENISNVLCSLRPKEDKLCFSAVFEINAKGDIRDYWLGKTILHSDHRFSYEEVQEIIEKKEGVYSKEILLLNHIAQKFRKKRFQQGAINFSSQEVRFQLDEKGKPVGIIVKESKEAHQLIEEFMLLANRTVAAHVSKIKPQKKDIPFPYRIHDQPDEAKLTPFILFARKFGYKFDISSPEKIAESFNQMLSTVAGKPEQHVLEQLGIRTMAKAAYATENIGHYGLGFEDYCHFTSPIRRYPDILVHRILESCLHNNPILDKKMEEKCTHCSERERAAMEVERAANKYKQVEYMRDYLGEEFEGVVSGVSGFGFWVETIEHKCEGLVTAASLATYDDFQLIETEYTLRGRRSGRSFRMGDRVWIKVVAANLEKRQLDYEWVVDGGKTNKDEKPAEKPKSKKALTKKAVKKEKL